MSLKSMSKNNKLLIYSYCIVVKGVVLLQLLHGAQFRPM